MGDSEVREGEECSVVFFGDANFACSMFFDEVCIVPFVRLADYDFVH